MGGLRHLRAEAALLSSQRWSGERSNFLLSTGCREIFSCRVQYQYFVRRAHSLDGKSKCNVWYALFE